MYTYLHPIETEDELKKDFKRFLSKRYKQEEVITTLDAELSKRMNVNLINKNKIMRLLQEAEDNTALTNKYLEMLKHNCREQVQIWEEICNRNNLNAVEDYYYNPVNATIHKGHLQAE